ncbi:hypothetical protein BH09MYX1_BH09MYX1_39190 [soil metagenome]
MFPILGAVAAALTVAGDAAASVSNPDYYFIDVPSGQDSIYVGPTAQFSLMTGQLEGDIDSAGAWTFGAAAFPQSLTGITISGGAVKAQLVILASGTSGSFLYNAARDVDLTLRARIVLTGPTITASCQTVPFTVTLSSTKTFTAGGSSLTGSPYNTTTGSFRVVASDFSIAAISTGCDTAAKRATINAALGFGASVGSVGLKFDRASVTSPAVLAP